MINPSTFFYTPYFFYTKNQCLMFDNSDTCCPSYLRLDELASHLNLCLCLERTKQFKESVATLQAWLDKRHTHPDIAFWVPRYLLGRNRIQFQALPFYTPPYFACNSPHQCNASRKSKILSDGHIFSKERYRNNFITSNRHTPLNGRDWVKSFISKLLNISHTEWLFCNTRQMPGFSSGNSEEGIACGDWETAQYADWWYPSRE
jgi:hypothetical protein